MKTIAIPSVEAGLRVGFFCQLIFVLTALAVFVVPAARAQTVVTAAWSDSIAGQTATSGRGQTFTASVAGILDTVTIQARSYQTGPEVTTFSLYEVTSPGVVNFVASTVVDASGLTPVAVPLQASFLSDNYNLVQGGQYAFNISYDSAGDTQSVLIDLGSAGYGGGEMVDIFGSSYAASGPTYDMLFSVTVSAIPEPSTYGLGIGALALGIGMIAKQRPVATRASRTDQLRSCP